MCLSRLSCTAFVFKGECQHSHTEFFKITLCVKRTANEEKLKYRSKLLCLHLGLLLPIIPDAAVPILVKPILDPHATEPLIEPELPNCCSHHSFSVQLKILTPPKKPPESPHTLIGLWSVGSIVDG